MLEVEKIENDKCEYTLDEQDKKVHDTILKPERTRSDTITLSRELSRRYPGMPLNQALRKENAKLRNELQQMQAMMEVDQVEVIEHLIGITETVDAKDVEEGLKQPDKVLSPDEPAAPEKLVSCLNRFESQMCMYVCIMRMMNIAVDYLWSFLHLEFRIRMVIELTDR